MADELTDFERRTLENGWIERDFTGIRLAVAQIVAARVAAARADERERITAAVEVILRAPGYTEAGAPVVCPHDVRAALARPTERGPACICLPELLPAIAVNCRAAHPCKPPVSPGSEATA